MCKIMKKLLSNKLTKTILSILLFACAFAIGYNVKSYQQNEQQQNDKIYVSRTLTQSTDDVHLDDGDTYIELSDGSWAIYGDSTHEYTFQPVDLGDYDYQLKSHKQLDNIIETYMSMKNNGYF